MATEKRMIDEFKNELMKEFIERCQGNDYNKLTLLRIGETIDRIYEKYSTIPTVDAVEVVHGRWVVENEASIRCSECCFNRASIKIPLDYCPNCGAKMDGDWNG